MSGARRPAGLQPGGLSSNGWAERAPRWRGSSISVRAAAGQCERLEDEAMREAVKTALTEAMKARDAARTSALRMINAAFKERDIEARSKGKAAATDDELLAALAKMVRQREESAKAFEDGGRPELVAKERAEIEVIRGFMPKQMSEEEVRAAAAAAIAETGATAARDMGKVMALLKQRHAGQMDFGKASAVVKGLLG
jgi:uncharacterized protein YqeY